MLGVWSRSRPRTRIVAGVVVLAVVGMAVWWLWWRGGTEANAQAQPTTQTVAASLETLEKTVTTSGTLTPLVQESVSFEVSGTVTSVQVAAGDTVEAGQVLATVDTLRLDADLLSAQADLAQAQADLAEAQADDDGTDAAQAKIDALAAQVDVAQADADDAQAATDGATLVAPVAGLVTSADLEVGDVVSGGSSGTSSSGSGSSGAAGGASGGTGSTSSASTTSGGFTIVGTDTWRVDASVGESDVALIEVGDQVEMTSDDLSGTVFGVVGEIGLVSTSTSGTAAYPVTVTVTGSVDGLHDGIAMDVEIVYERRTDVLTVPSAAVTTGDDGATTVTQLDADGAQVQTTVETGETSGDVTEIVSGLAEGDEVVMQVFTGGGGNGSDDSGQTMPGGGQMPDGFDPSQFEGGGPGGSGGGQMPGGGGRNG